MSGFGEKLKREREAQRTSLEEISAATKISVRLLEAIEAEHFERLPGGIFNLNFVRQYARHLHLDEEQIVNEFRALTAPPTDSQVDESKPMLPE
jgi:cytoskeletal protein RodZ